jgi:transcriptional regulator with XRE-family HTH domain
MTGRKQPLDVAIGQRLAGIRKRRNLTQKQLAAAIGVTRYQIINYETARTELRPGRIAELARVLKCAPAEITGVPERRPKSRSLLQKIKGLILRFDAAV